MTSHLVNKCLITQMPYFFSRQRYMLGDGAMMKMAQANVFLSGLGGLGVEIGEVIKFLVLSFKMI